MGLCCVRIIAVLSADRLRWHFGHGPQETHVWAVQ